MDESGTELTPLPESAQQEQGEPAPLLEQSQSCPRDGIGEEFRDGSAMGLTCIRNFRERLAPGKWIRSHPVLTVVLAVLLALVVALAVSFAVVCSGRRCGEIPVKCDTPQCLPCTKGWVGYHGICYLVSKDRCSWDQAQARCSEHNASLAMANTWDMRFLSCLSENDNPWIGLRRQDQGLQWVNGSSFTLSVEVQDEGECVFLGNDKFGRGNCSDLRPYLCSRPQTPS